MSRSIAARLAAEFRTALEHHWTHNIRTRMHFHVPDADYLSAAEKALATVEDELRAPERQAIAERDRIFAENERLISVQTELRRTVADLTTANDCLKADLEEAQARKPYLKIG